MAADVVISMIFSVLGIGLGSSGAMLLRDNVVRQEQTTDTIQITLEGELPLTYSYSHGSLGCLRQSLIKSPILLWFLIHVCDICSVSWPANDNKNQLGGQMPDFVLHDEVGCFIGVPHTVGKNGNWPEGGHHTQHISHNKSTRRVKYLQLNASE